MTAPVYSEALAHVTPSGRLHPLVDHLRSVGEMAAGFATAFGSPEPAVLAGIWHDLGKYAGNFQKMIREANGMEAHIEDTGGPRDHSTAGAIHAQERLGPHGLPIAFAIAGHHAGLDDLENLRQRLHAKRERYESTLRASPARDILEQPHAIVPQAFRGTPQLLELWTRMLFSALCDADFLDTELFFEPSKSAQRGASTTIRELRTKLDTYLDDLEKRARDSEVNRVRAEVRRSCIASARLPCGAFSLTVPTGGGKTLAALQFALAHAEANGLRRVIVAIPFTSIIEQTAEVYRSALGKENVLEHHSAIDPRHETPRSRIATENWDAPVVVTTNVQLFESLFANRPSACRKLHRIAKSVIVLDEAQALPPGMLAPTLDVLQSLVQHFGASVVLSTATQPAFSASAAIPEGLTNVREIVPQGARAFERLRRVRVRWPTSRDRLTSYEDLSREIAAESDVLAIVHRRDDARKLCEALDRELGATSTVHLSALMCAEHRSHVLAEIKARKGRGEPVRLVSTQVVETGVDLDFAVVYRALGGLDSLAQAAGRCNREGLRELGELRVFRAPTDPPRGVLASGFAVATAMLAARPGLDLFAPPEHRQYFEQLYNVRSRDEKGIQTHRGGLKFRTVASLYRLIDDAWSEPVVVPYGNSAEAIAQVDALGPSRDRLRALQRYIVNVPKRLREAWLAAGVARLSAETVAVLDERFRATYDAERFGLILDPSAVADPAAFIV